MATYMRIYKKGDIVDIKVSSRIGETTSEMRKVGFNLILEFKY